MMLSKKVGIYQSGSKQFEIYSVDTVANSPIVAPFLKALADLIEQGQSEPNIVNVNNYPAIFLQESEKIVGFTVYTVIKDSRILWKFLTFVDPEYRQQGIGTKLNSLIDDIARLKDCIKVQSHVHVNNASMIACNEASGMTQQFIKFSKDIT